MFLCIPYHRHHADYDTHRFLPICFGATEAAELVMDEDVIAHAAGRFVNLELVGLSDQVPC